MTVSVQMLLTAIAIAAAVSGALVAATLPLLRRHALAHPIARSSHRVPTPQGAGVGVIAATLAAAGLVLATSGPSELHGIVTVFAATVALALVGAVDDLKPIPIAPRLLLQAAAVAAMLSAIPEGTRVSTAIPFWAERTALFLASVWFVNVVNFMDGIDWITVAEVVPVSAALAVFGLAGHVSTGPAVAAGALCGAYLGFAPFNRPVARIFLGDVGSLPTGLLLAWCLTDLAMHGQLAAALLLPLYYLVDATWTLLRRVVRNDRFWIAHREHFYQLATDQGLPVMQVVGHIFALNLMLAALAALTIAKSGIWIQTLAVVAGSVCVGIVLWRFSRANGKRPS